MMASRSRPSRSRVTRQDLSTPTPAAVPLNPADSDAELDTSGVGPSKSSGTHLEVGGTVTGVKQSAISPLSAVSSGGASTSSAKENVEPSQPTATTGPKKRSSGGSKNQLTMSYPKKKKKRPSTSVTSSASKAKRGRPGSGRRLSASSTVSDSRSVVTVISAAGTSKSKVVAQAQKSDAAQNDKTKEAEDDEEDADTDDDDDEPEKGEFVVERIDDKQIIEGKTFYLIKWKGWAETANTWEPVDNLGGCPELLDAFEKRQSEKKILTARRRISGATRRRTSLRDDDDDEEMNTTRNNMKCYGVLKVWPADKDPISVEGVISVEGTLTYIVKKDTRRGSQTLDRRNAVLVQAAGFREWYPELIIKYYESKVLWCEDDKDGTDKAATAAQMSLLQKNRGSKVGREIAKDVDKELAKKYNIREPSQPAEVVLAVPSTSKAAYGEVSKLSETETQMEMDPKTQLVGELGNKDSTGESDDEDMDVDVELEEDGVPNEKGKTDKFGLPENIDDTTTSCETDTDNESEQEAEATGEI